jgi:hypothetical protein
VLITLGLFGCGSKPGSVSGKVTYQGKPLTSGLVIFIDKDGRVSQPAGIEVDGSYVADNVPLGPVAVCVETHPLSGGDGGPNAPQDQPRPRYVPLPAKYKDAKQSGLTLDVKPGPNVYDIELH